MRVCVSPSAGAVVADASTLEALAEGDGFSKLTVAVFVSVVPSVVSIAVSVTVSATESVTVNEIWPFEPVVAGDGAPMLAVEELAWRLTAFPGTALSPDVNKVTIAVVPRPPTGAGVVAVTVDCEPETVRLPNVTDAVFAMTVLPAVVSVAVNFTVSAVLSVAVKVATPSAFVLLGEAAGVIVAWPLPSPSVTVSFAIGCAMDPWSRRVTVIVVEPLEATVVGLAITEEFAALVVGL
jgi:hypothetical protein